MPEKRRKVMGWLQKLFGGKKAYLLWGTFLTAFYWLISVVLFELLFAAGESVGKPTGVYAAILQSLGVIAYVLEFPFLYIEYIPGGVALSRAIFGNNDSLIIIILSGLSALFWAIITIWLYRLWRFHRRRTTQSHIGADGA
jgi:hypothetical protein